MPKKNEAPKLPPRTVAELVRLRSMRGRSETQRPRTLAWVAKQCQVSEVYLSRIASGQRPVGSDELPPWTEARVAKGLGVSRATLRAAVKRTKAEAERS